MKCEICGMGPIDGVTVYRQNAKGQPGVWRCADHRQAAVTAHQRSKYSQPGGPMTERDTRTPAQRRVQPGDTIRSQGNPYEWQVLCVREDGVEVDASPHALVYVLFVPWSQVILPDPPKAKPGVLYRHEPTGRLGVGRTVGSLYVAVNDHQSPFDPDEWEEVTDA